MENSMAERLVVTEWTGSEFDLIARLLPGNPWNAPTAARLIDSGLWVPGFTFVFASKRMTWFALTTPKQYAAIKPWVID